jgi:hypothetical protein
VHQIRPKLAKTGPELSKEGLAGTGFDNLSESFFQLFKRIWQVKPTNVEICGFWHAPKPTASDNRAGRHEEVIKIRVYTPLF